MGQVDRLSQFRSHLKDWGFDNPNPTDNEIFFHPCFQKAEPSLCRYMRCGKTKVDNDNISDSNDRKNEGLMTNTKALVSTNNAKVLDDRSLMNGSSISTATVSAANATSSNAAMNTSTN